MASNPSPTPPPASSVILGRPEETPTGLATTMTHVVSVGKKADRFDPEIIMANAGDKIFFRFYPTNHSIVRGTFERPCIPYEMQNPRVDKNGAIWSGWAPVSMIKLEDEMPSFTWTVRTADQLFLYCGAPGSCNKAGMVMMINPNGSVPFEIYRQAALAAPFALTPGQAFPPDENYGERSTTTSSLSIPPPTNPPGSLESNSQNKDLAAIAGIVVGGIGAMAIIGLIIALVFRYRVNRSDSTASNSPQHNSHLQPGMSLAPSFNSPGNPYFHANSSFPYTPELAPGSPTIQPNRYSGYIPGSNRARRVQSHDTTMIPVRDDDRSYFEGVHGTQSSMSSGGASPVSTTGTHTQLHRSSNSGSPHGNSIFSGAHFLGRRGANRSWQHGEYGTRHRPAEMAASVLEEEKCSKEEDAIVVDGMDPSERYGQVYPR
ncbi:hypothetical protein TWF225_007476 [Orbilia oligospora]|nr:hypothetical protein TWF225_007476 [Orbilia oligospora]KAF3235689.1 hypothetical protein TWF128_001771 [Orbilia oligospora]KAF3278618.1 hypothetical protein TWF132_000913 [Orbilia oligospora]